MKKLIITSVVAIAALLGSINASKYYPGATSELQYLEDGKACVQETVVELVSNYEAKGFSKQIELTDDPLFSTKLEVVRDGEILFTLTPGDEDLMSVEFIIDRGIFMEDYVALLNGSECVLILMPHIHVGYHDRNLLFGIVQEALVKEHPTFPKGIKFTDPKKIFWINRYEIFLQIAS